MTALQLDLFAPPPPILGGSMAVRVRRPMRLAPCPDTCPECGGGCWGVVMEQGDEIHEVAARCTRCGHLVARTPRLRRQAVALLDTFGEAACGRGPRRPMPLPVDRAPWACAWDGKREGCACRRGRPYWPGDWISQYAATDPVVQQRPAMFGLEVVV